MQKELRQRDESATARFMMARALSVEAVPDRTAQICACWLFCRRPMTSTYRPSASSKQRALIATAMRTACSSYSRATSGRPMQPAKRAAARMAAVSIRQYRTFTSSSDWMGTPRSHCSVQSTNCQKPVKRSRPSSLRYRWKYSKIFSTPGKQARTSSKSP